MADDLLDDPLLLEVLEGTAGERAVDLQSVDEDGDGDEAVGLDILLELLVGVLVEDDGVLGLVLDCEGGKVLVEVRWAVGGSGAPRRWCIVRTLSLGPLLLLLLASRCCWCHFVGSLGGWSVEEVEGRRRCDERFWREGACACPWHFNSGRQTLCLTSPLR